MFVAGSCLPNRVGSYGTNRQRVLRVENGPVGSTPAVEAEGTTTKGYELQQSTHHCRFLQEVHHLVAAADREHAHRLSTP